MKFVLFICWDLIHFLFLFFRFSILCLILIGVNASFAYLLPIAIVLDIGVFRFCTQIVFSNQLRILEKNIQFFIDRAGKMGVVNNDIVDRINEEIGRYQIWQWGNRNGNKKVCVVQTNQPLDRFASVPLFNDTSVVFASSTFFPQHPRDRVLLAHEFSHCVSHDLMLVLRLLFYTTAIFYPLLVMICSCSVLWSLSAVLVGWTMYRLFQVGIEPYREIEANNKALEVIGTLFGKDGQKQAAKILLQIRKRELEENQEGGKKRIVGQTILRLQIEFLNKCVETGALINQISPINKFISLSFWILFGVTMYNCAASVSTFVIPSYAVWFSVVLALIIWICLKINRIVQWKKKIKLFQQIGII